ncbi:MAG: hypothetical protein M3Q69_15425, partial [Acidobacteriota bacterium]|nr:hypothetical protein [Acidobacteriota bacterium]
MKRALLAVSLLLCTAAHAQRIDSNAVLRTYAEKVLPRCPDGVVTLEPVQGGPANFNAFVVQVRSSDKYCGTQKYLLYSPKTQQIVIGSIIPMQPDGRPVSARITEQATQMLGHAVRATVAPFPLPDGLKSVAITRDTQWGPFSYQGFVDQSESYLIVGMRGSLTTDPAKSLREALGL